MLSDNDPPPSRAVLRRLMAVLFRADADLEALIGDHFGSVKQRLGGMMDRVSKTNILLEQATPAELWAVLNRWYPAELNQHQKLLDESPKASEAARRREELRGRLELLLRDLEAYRRHGDDTCRIEDRILEVRRQLRSGLALQERDVLSQRYSLMQPLGQGGVATVWHAYDRNEGTVETRRVVAIKVLHGQMATDQSAIERFRRGARKMMELSHPAVVRVLDGPIEEDELHFFVMEYVPNQTLHEAVLKQQIDRQQVLDAILRVGEALEEAHRRNFIHRDVKPQNILMDGEWLARLTDFDLVLGLDNTALSIAGHAKGTYRYAAPEQMQGLPGQDLRVDVYGLAMTTLFALRGEELPLPEISRPSETIQALKESEAIKAVLLRATAVSKENRHESIRSYCEALREALAAKPQSAELVQERKAPLAIAMREDAAAQLRVLQPAAEETALSKLPPDPQQDEPPYPPAGLAGRVARQTATLELPKQARLPAEEAYLPWSAVVAVPSLVRSPLLIAALVSVFAFILGRKLLSGPVQTTTDIFADLGRSLATNTIVRAVDMSDREPQNMPMIAAEDRRDLAVMIPFQIQATLTQMPEKDKIPAQRTPKDDEIRQINQQSSIKLGDIPNKHRRHAERRPGNEVAPLKSQPPEPERPSPTNRKIGTSSQRAEAAAAEDSKKVKTEDVGKKEILPESPTAATAAIRRVLDRINFSSCKGEGTSSREMIIGVHEGKVYAAHPTNGETDKVTECIAAKVMPIQFSKDPEDAISITYKFKLH